MPEKSTTPDLTVLVQRANTVGDFDAAMDLYAPDAVWDMSEGGMGVIEGREEIRAFFEEWLGAYEEYEQEVEEIRDLGTGWPSLCSSSVAGPQGAAGGSSSATRVCCSGRTGSSSG